uniref:Asparagine--tRNA ligase, mitochondrial n=1 Tax=Culex pipiens TaxID=7175 RepID=A0A8D8IY11_CULPI
MYKALLSSIRVSRSTNLRSIYHLTRVKDVAAGVHSEGDKIQVKGWVKSVRKMKDNVFLDVNDGTCTHNLQLVVSKPQLRDTAYGSSVNVTGTLGRTPKKSARAQSRLAAGAWRLPPSRRLSVLPEKVLPARLHPEPFAPAAAGQFGGVHTPCAASSHQVLQRLPGPRRLHPDPHANHHVQRLRGRRRSLPGPTRKRRPSQADGQKGRPARPGVLRSPNVPHRLRSASPGSDGTRPGQGLHVWTDIPCGELQVPDSPGRVSHARTRGSLHGLTGRASRPNRIDGQVCNEIAFRNLLR